MPQASCKTIVNLPADAVWQVLGDFGAACQYLDMVINCTVAGEGVGALRTLTYAGGSAIVERLETLDDAARKLSYALLTDTPFRDCLTTMAVRDLGSNQAELEWSATFRPDGLPASEAVALLEGALAANCLALKQFVEGGKK